MFSKDEIEAWIDLATTGINKMDPAAKTVASIKLRVLEAKMMTDRWGNVATDYVIHSSHKDSFRKALGASLQIAGEPAKESSILIGLLNRIANVIPNFSEKDIPKPTVDLLWGANIHYSDNIPEDVGLALVLENGQLYDNCAECFDDGESEVDRCVAVFTM